MMQELNWKKKKKKTRHNEIHRSSKSKQAPLHAIISVAENSK